MKCTKEIRIIIAIAQEGFNKMIKLLCGPLKERNEEEMSKVLYMEFGIIRGGNVDNKERRREKDRIF
ncbi:MAG: hypothetical protein ACEY3A_03205 [Wolbachia sp.]